MIVYIYSLTDPITNLVRYVGKTNNLKLRFNTHIHKTKHLAIGQNPKKTNWIASLLSRNLKPKMDTLEVVDDSTWEEAEIKWIKHFRDLGNDLTNFSDGGDHINPILKGEDSPSAKFTNKDILEIRRLYAETEASQPDLALMFDTSQGHIQRIVTGEVWSHLPAIPKSSSKPQKKRNKSYKLTNEQAFSIREQFRDTDLHINDLAKMYKVSTTTIRSILHGTNYMAAGGTTSDKLYKRKLTAEKVAEIRRMVADKAFSKSEIARLFDIDPTSIRDIIYGITWNDGTMEIKKPGYARGEDAGAAKLSAREVREIRELHAQGKATSKELARLYNVVPTTIRLIVRKKRWRHIE